MVSRGPLDPCPSCYTQQRHRCRYKKLQKRCLSGGWGQTILLCTRNTVTLFGAFPWDSSRCAHLSLWLALEPDLSTESYEKKSPSCQYSSYRKGARHVFSGNIYNSHYFQNKQRTCASILSEPITCRSTGPAREEGAAISKDPSSATTPTRYELAFGMAWERVRKSSGLYRTIFFAIATVPDNVTSVYHQTNSICYRFSCSPKILYFYDQWIEYSN